LKWRKYLASKSFLLLIFAEQKEALFKKTTIVRENNESTLLK